MRKLVPLLDCDAQDDQSTLTPVTFWNLILIKLCENIIIPSTI
jgi:hypothetical protein